jgi:hypothetical protein
MKISMNHSRPADDSICPLPEIAADLKAYADNELSLLRRRQITVHLRQCAACREEINAMTNVAKEIKTADIAAPGGGASGALNSMTRQRLLDRIAAEPSPTVPTSKILPLWRRKPLLVFGSGVAYTAICLVLMAFLVPTFSRSREKARQVSAERPASFTGKRESLSDDNVRTYNKPFLKEYDSRGREIPGTSALRPRSATATTAKSPISDGVEYALETPAGHPSQGASFGLIDGRQVHREGSLTVAVDKLEAASDKVEQAVKASGGVVASNNLATDDSGYKTADLVVRVPVARFDEMLKQFASLGSVTSKGISGEDITERVSDATQAEQVLKDAADAATRKLRIGSGTEKEIRYREADLRRVRIELAQTQARLGLLRKMARLSTINVSLTEKAKSAARAPQGGFLGDMSETNRLASAAFTSAVRVPVVLIIWVLAFSPLWVPLALIYRYASRRSAGETRITPSASSIEA